MDTYENRLRELRLISLGQKLQLARRDRKLTQAAVARAMRISQSYLSKVESGAQEPGFLLVERMAAYYNATLGEYEEKRGKKRNEIFTLTQERRHSIHTGRLPNDNSSNIK